MRAKDACIGAWYWKALGMSMTLFVAVDPAEYDAFHADAGYKHEPNSSNYIYGRVIAATNPKLAEGWVDGFPADFVFPYLEGPP